MSLLEFSGPADPALWPNLIVEGLAGPKNLVPKLDSHIQDTPDFLRVLEEVKKEGPLPPNSILATVDVTGLYTNIPKDDGLAALH